MSRYTLRRTGAFLASAGLLASLTVAAVAAPASAGKCAPYPENDLDSGVADCYYTTEVTPAPYVPPDVTLNGTAEGDTVGVVDGTFNGGGGNDFADEVNGTFNGGGGNDFADEVNGTFNGGPGDDGIEGDLQGTFNGGGGDDCVYQVSSGSTFAGGGGSDWWNTPEVSGATIWSAEWDDSTVCERA